MISLLRRRREEAGVAQQVLAERVGVSRQALTAIEAGRQVPSTSLALSLARALECRVEDLFVLAPAGALEVELALPDAPPGGRVILGRVGGRWVGHLVREAPIGADGVLVAAGAVEPLDEPRALERNVLVAGCAPLIGTLAGAVARRHRDARVRWLHANSEEALGLLERDQVHVAGLHLAAGRSREDAAALVRERFPGRRMLVVNLTCWRQGLVVAAGNPLGLREAGDLVRGEVRLARREPGAGAAKLLERLVRGKKRALRPGPLARTHEEVALLVRSGAADAGVAIESSALASGLGFVPMSEERFDLVMREEALREEPVARLLDALEDAAFRAEARALPGYDTSLTGQTTRVA